MKSFVPLLLLPATLALVIRDLQPRHKPWNTQPWGHHGTAYHSPTQLCNATTTVTITTTVTLGTVSASASTFPNGTATSTAGLETLAPIPNDIPPITLIEVTTLPNADATSADPVAITAAPTGDEAAAPAPNDIPPVQLITIL